MFVAANDTVKGVARGKMDVLLYNKRLYSDLFTKRNDVLNIDVAISYLRDIRRIVFAKNSHVF